MTNVREDDPALTLQHTRRALLTSDLFTVLPSSERERRSLQSLWRYAYYELIQLTALWRDFEQSST